MEIKISYKDNEVTQLLQYLTKGIIDNTYTGWVENIKESRTDNDYTVTKTYSITIPNPNFTESTKKVEEGINVVLVYETKISNSTSKAEDKYTFSVSDKTGDTLLYTIEVLNANNRKYSQSSVPVNIDYLYNALYTYLFGDDAKEKSIKERIMEIINYNNVTDNTITYEQNNLLRYNFMLFVIDKLEDMDTSHTYIEKINPIKNFIEDRYFTSLSVDEIVALNDILNYVYLKGYSYFTILVSLYDIIAVYDEDTVKGKEQIINLATNVIIL